MSNVNSKRADKIGYEQLKDCKNIICSRGELLTADGKKLLAEINRLVGESRFHGYCDYTYELLQALEGNNSIEAKLVRDKYFPAPEYDPSRDI